MAAAAWFEEEREVADGLKALMHADGPAVDTGIGMAEVFVSSPVYVQRAPSHVMGIVMKDGLTRMPIQKAAFVMGDALGKEPGSQALPEIDKGPHDRHAVDGARPYHGGARADPSWFRGRNLSSKRLPEAAQASHYFYKVVQAMYSKSAAMTDPRRAHADFPHEDTGNPVGGA
jgi:hypothetical protein